MSAPGEGPQIVHVDLERCVGHGKCYGVAPHLMQPFDDDGHAEFYGAPIDLNDSNRASQAQSAIDSCPEEALSWRNAAGT